MAHLTATHTSTEALEAVYTSLQASSGAAWAAYRAADNAGLIWARVSDEREVFLAFSNAMLAVSNELAARELAARVAA